ncbi:MAG: hypothetical protein CM1200mP28_02390 [Deltaproteobacteria bacterium]|nr:MAG: hypothetical protein CM1200mP28_02390 [Deltaproteobacteria bacterium]
MNDAKFPDQVATYLTDCPQSTINILGSEVQQCKASFGFKPEELDMMKGKTRVKSLSVSSALLNQVSPDY